MVWIPLREDLRGVPSRNSVFWYVSDHYATCLDYGSLPDGYPAEYDDAITQPHIVTDRYVLDNVRGVVRKRLTFEVMVAGENHTFFAGVKVIADCHLSLSLDPRAVEIDVMTEIGIAVDYRLAIHFKRFLETGTVPLD